MTDTVLTPFAVAEQNDFTAGSNLVAGASAPASGKVASVTFIDRNGVEQTQAITGNDPVELAVQYGTLKLFPDGKWDFDPFVLDHGPNGGDPIETQFSVEIEDGGATIGTVQQTVQIVDELPTANDDLREAIDYGEVAGGGVLDNDRGTNDGPNVVTTVGEFTTALGGTIEMDATGKYTYTAPANLNFSAGQVTDTFEYTIEDGDGSQASATLSIPVNPPAAPPPTGGNGDTFVVSEEFGDTVARADYENPLSDKIDLAGEGTLVDSVRYEGENGPVTVSVAAGSESDRTDPLDVYEQLDGVTTKIGSLVVFADGTWRFDPEQLSHTDSQPIAASFDYTIKTGDSGQPSAFITQQISVLDETPTATDDMATGTIAAGSTVGGGVLGNDLGTNDLVSEAYRDTYQDPDAGMMVVGVRVAGSNDDFTPVSVNSDGSIDTGLGGTLTMAANGGYTYLAPSGDGGADAIEYLIEDGDGSQDTAILTLTVGDAGDPTVDPQPTFAVREDYQDTNARADFADPNSALIDLADNGEMVHSIEYKTLENDQLVTKTMLVGATDDGSNGSETPFVDVYDDKDGAIVKMGALKVFANGVWKFDPAVQEHDAGQPVETSFAYTLKIGENGTPSQPIQQGVSILDMGPDAQDDAHPTVVQPGQTEGGGVLNNDLGTVDLADAAYRDQFNLSDESTASNMVVEFREVGSDTWTTVDLANGGSFTTALGGTITMQANGAYTYEHGGTGAGIEEIEYKIVDGDGSEDTAVLTIPVAAAPPPPTVGEQDPFIISEEYQDTNAVADYTDPNSALIDLADGNQQVFSVTYKTLEGGALVEKTEEVRDGDDYETSFLPVYDEIDGEIIKMGDLKVWENGVWKFDPAVQEHTQLYPGAVPVDTAFTYTVRDGSEGTPSAPVVQKISILDNTPEANDDVHPTTVAAGQTEGGGLLGNDIGTVDVADADYRTDPRFDLSDEATASNKVIAFKEAGTDTWIDVTLADGGTITTELGGTLTVMANGGYTYTAPAGKGGDELIDYMIEDGDGSRSTATLTIDVAAAPPPPIVAEGDDYVVREDYGPTNARENYLDGNSPLIDLADGSEQLYSVTYTTLEDGTLVDRTVVMRDTDDGSGLWETPDLELWQDIGGEPTYMGTLKVYENGVWKFDPAVQDHAQGADGSVPVETAFQFTLRDGDIGQVSEPVNQTIKILDTAPEANADGNQVIEGGDVTVGGGVLGNDTGSVDVADAAYRNAFDLADESTASNKVVAVREAGGTWTDVDLTNGGTVTTSLGGTLVILANGAYQYTPPEGGVDHTDDVQVFDTFEYRIVDGDGSASTAPLSIEILDTEPVAYTDYDIVERGDLTTGNVITAVDDDAAATSDSDTIDPGLAADNLGADATVVVEVNYTDADGNAATAFVDQDAGDGRMMTTFETEQGSVVFYSDGSYEYTANSTGNGSDDEGGTVTVASFGLPEGGSAADMQAAWTGADFGSFDLGTPILSDGKLNFAGMKEGLESFTGRGVGLSEGDERGLAADNQINHDPSNGDTQGLVVSLDSPGEKATFTVSNLFNTEEEGEVGVWHAFAADGTLVGTGSFGADNIDYDGSTNVGTVSIEPGAPFSHLVFSSTFYDEDAGNADSRPNDSSDYFLRSLEVTASGDGASEDVMTYVLEDADGDRSSADLIINLTGDPGDPNLVPDAIDDMNSVDEGKSTSGTVIANDDQGDPDGTITAIGDDAIPEGGLEVPGTYGKLVIQQDGTYTYTANPDAPQGAQDSFGYTLTDADGDTDTATLTITIDQVGVPGDGATAKAAVDEAGLDLVKDGADLEKGTVVGSKPDATSETVEGAIDFGDQAGAAVAGTFTGSFGVLQVNEDGTFTYTLTANSTDHTTVNSTAIDGVSESFPVTVIDGDGNTGSATIVIDINDDVPEARTDYDIVAADSVTTGNVITGVDPDTQDGTSDSAGILNPGAGLAADTEGADGARVVEVNYTDADGNAATATLPTPTGDEVTSVTFTTQGGDVVFNSDGSYSYTATSLGSGASGGEGETLVVIGPEPGTDTAGADKATWSDLLTPGADDPAFSVTFLAADGTEQPLAVKQISDSDFDNYSGAGGAKVSGADNIRDAEISANNSGAESIRVDLGTTVASANVGVAALFDGVNFDNGNMESLTWTVFKDGDEVGSGSANGDFDGLVDFTIADVAGGFDTIVLTPDSNQIAGANNSDFLLHHVYGYGEAGTDEDVMTYVLEDADGDRSSADLIINLSDDPGPQPEAPALEVVHTTNPVFTATVQDGVYDPDGQVGVGDYLSQNESKALVDEDGKPLSDLPDGAPTVGGVDPANLTVAYDTEASIQFQTEGAGWKNTVGTYQLDENGDIIADSIKIVWQNASQVGNNTQPEGYDADGEPTNANAALVTDHWGDPQAFTQDLGQIEAGATLGFFQIARGASDFNAIWDQFDSLEAANAATWSLDAEGRLTVDTGEEVMTFTGNTWFSHHQDDVNEVNSDGFQHVVSGVSTNDDGYLYLGFEDKSLGDRDFNDTVFRVDLGDANLRKLTGQDYDPDVITVDDEKDSIAKATVEYKNPGRGEGLTFNTAMAQQMAVVVTATLAGGAVMVLDLNDPLPDGITKLVFDGVSGDQDSGSTNYFDLLDSVQVDVPADQLPSISEAYALGDGQRELVFTVEDEDGLIGEPEVVPFHLEMDVTDGTTVAKTITGEDGTSNLLVGSDAGDTLTAGDSGDQIFGGDGDDLLVGGDGDDEIVTGLGDDEVYAGKGDDLIVANGGNNTVHGEEGNDILVYVHNPDATGTTTTFHGGDGWADAIQLTQAGGDGVGAPGSGGWTVDFVQGGWENEAEGILSGDSAGTITFGDTGATIEFDGLEKIQWS